MDVLTHVLAKIQTAVWGPPTLFLLCLLYTSLRLKRKITHATIGIAYSFPYFQHP